MFTRNLTTILLALSAFIALPSCSTSDSEPPAGYSALMTYNGIVGEAATFTFYSTTSDVPEIFTTQKIAGLTDEDVSKRVALNFYLSDNHQMSVMQYRVVPTAFLTMADTEEAEANNNPVDVLSLERQGPYLNLMAKLPSEVTHTYSIVCDRATAYTENPHLYLSITQSTEPSGIRQYMLSCYDISQIWNNGATRTVTVHVNNSAPSGPKVFTFTKQ